MADHNEIRDTEWIRARLRHVGRQRAKLEESRQTQTTTLREAARMGDDAGLTRSEIARLAGLSRKGLYHIMRWGPD